ncbi:MAG: hypothetical protein SFU25_01545 [Candidatus Caenarcaniphilales bacterium]|nr:hypothetical protein [Candidatus Caenarcaniphilales bacterium]
MKSITFSLLVIFFSASLLQGCNSAGTSTGSAKNLTGYWIWVAKQKGQTVSQGYFNFKEDNGNVTGTTHTVTPEDNSKKKVAIAYLPLVGKRTGKNLKFQINRQTTQIENEATISDDFEKMTGATTQNLPYSREIEQLGEKFKDETGHEMVKVQYEWSAQRVKDEKAVKF